MRRYGAFYVDRHGDAAEDQVSRRQLELHDSPGHDDALAALVASLADAGLTRSRIGIDEIGLMPGHFRTLEESLPDADFVPASALFRHVRAVKTGEEIARLARVAEIAER